MWLLVDGFQYSNGNLRFHLDCDVLQVVCIFLVEPAVSTY
jgi:hypothetical protein